MEFKDYYGIMDVSRDSTQDDIKRAYRKLARKFHPDVSTQPDAEVRFKELGEAYEVLKDPEKRAAYNQLGENWKAGQEFHAPPGWDAGFEFRGGDFATGNTTDFSDFFSSLFGQEFHHNQRQHGPRGRGRGEDHHATVVIDLEDVWRDVKRTITLNVPALDAQGHLINRQRTLNIRIPKGVKQGQHIRLAGQGEQGQAGNPPGDLYLRVEFKPHRLYQVDGRDLYLQLAIAPWEAALGASVNVPTPNGVVELKIPAGAVNGRKLRLKNRGIPGTPPGDLYAVLSVTLPAADTEEAKSVYRQMEQKLKFNPRSNLGV